MKTPPQRLSYLLVCSLSVLGCAADQDGAADELADDTTSTTSVDSTAGVDPSSDGGADTDASPSFVDPPDAGSSISECDVWMNDCPEGEKCMPWANDGGNSWNATRCSEIDANPDAVGDTCTVDGSGTSGIDSCGARSMCYYVDSESGAGVCVAFCVGSAMSPSCEDPEDICTIANDGVLTVCRPSCDPLLQDCIGDAVCMQAPGSLAFTCMIDISNGDEVAGEPCEYNNSCPPGLTCEPAEGVPGCVAERCCTPWCNLSDPDPDAACPLAGQECLAYEADAPPGLQQVGICLLPPT